MSDIMKSWKQKELWHRHGKGFCVEISRHTQAVFSDREGPNRWCVYAYIYPSHPHFDKFENDNVWQDATINMPLHEGPSFLKLHRDANGSPSCVQVGADYNHFGDNVYTFFDKAYDAYEVFRDANELVEWLTTKAEQCSSTSEL